MTVTAPQPAAATPAAGRAPTAAVGSAVVTRVTVLAPRTRIDVALPSDVSVADLLPVLLDMAQEGSPDGGARHGGWCLARIGQAAMEPARTLTGLGVLDGELLTLCKRTESPPLPLFDDVVDAVALSTPNSYRPWTERTARAIGASVAVLALGTAAVAVLLAGPGLAEAIVSGTTAVLLVGTAAVLSRAYRDPAAAVVLAAGALTLAFVAGLHAVPGGPGRPNVLLGCIGVVVVSAAALGLLGTGVTVFTAAAAAGLLGAAAALVATLVAHPLPGIGAGLAATALVLLSAAPRLTIHLARLPLPAVPITLRELDEDDATDFPDFATIERQAALGHQYLTGMVIGLGTSAAAGALLAAPNGTLGVVLAAVVAAVLMLRARTYANGVQAVALLLAGTAAAGGLLVGWLVRADDGTRLLWVFGSLVLRRGRAGAGGGVPAAPVLPTPAPRGGGARGLAHRRGAAARARGDGPLRDDAGPVTVLPVRRLFAAAVTLVLLTPPATASAQEPPPVPAPLPPPIAAQLPTADPVGPDLGSGLPVPRTTVQQQRCPTSSGAGTDLVAEAPWAQTQLGFEQAHQISTGVGQRVAVIDTGVSPHPRLPGLVGLGDYVAAGADGRGGLVDCDAHGTFVAGIIAAVADSAQQTGFVGVAPGAQVLSIRQSSGVYSYEPARVAGESGVGDAVTLARAVRLAVDSGAGVINISESACVAAASTAVLQDAGLGAALAHAVEQDVVVVVAAGNTSGVDSGTAGGGCPEQNYPPDAPDAVLSVATPAWWDDYVLTVGSVGVDGAPSDFSLAGPWVDVAAPGEDILSLSPAGGSDGGSEGLANQVTTAQGRVSAIQGTSFAAPYVAGTVALVRSAFPELDARQVMNRVEATARPPAGGWDPYVGHGVIDPVAAVSDVLPADVSPQQVIGRSSPIAPTVPEPVPDTTPCTVALVGSATALGAAALSFAVLDAVRRARRRDR